MNWELPDVQVGFRKGRETRDQIADICWIIEKATEFQKNIYFCLIDYAKAFDCVDHNKLWKILQAMAILDHLNLPPEKPVYRSRSNTWNRTWNNGEDPDLERSTSRLYIVTCLFNFYAENVMWLDEAQAGIKIAGRNINNLRYAVHHP